MNGRATTAMAVAKFKPGEQMSHFSENLNVYCTVYINNYTIVYQLHAMTFVYNGNLQNNVCNTHL